MPHDLKSLVGDLQTAIADIETFTGDKEFADTESGFSPDKRLALSSRGTKKARFHYELMEPRYDISR